MGTRLILLVIAAIFLGGLIFFGNRFSAGFRDRFLSVFPRGQNAQLSQTPTPIPFGALITTTPQPTGAGSSSQSTANQNIQGTQTKGGLPTESSTPSNEIPNTGPAEVLWLALGASFVSGYFLRKKAENR